MTTQSTFEIDQHSRPFTHLEFKNDPDEFQFAFLSDNAGGSRPGVLPAAVRMLNLLQPEFVVGLGDLIEGYTARVNQARAGLPNNVFMNITLQNQDQADLEAFEKAVQQIPEVMECYLMTGDFDYLLRVVVSDTADFERLHSHTLTRLPGVSRVQSSFALRTVRKSSELPVGD